MGPRTSSGVGVRLGAGRGSRPRAEEAGGHHRVWVGVRVRVRVRLGLRRQAGTIGSGG